MKLNFIFILLLSCETASAQNSPLYNSLPVGKYAVGFKIITLTDSSRISRPEYNYLGEKYTGDRTKKISIHIWYPAEPNTAVRQITFGDYCYNGLLESTESAISSADKTRELNGRRSAIERWFEKKISDGEWQNLAQTPMLAGINARALQGKFPLLIGELRVLSTSLTNEILASNGYVVAMVRSDEYALDTFAEEALCEIPDMQFAINYLQKHESVDADKTGTFGFSGSGFAQVLLGMYDYRIKAVADIESGIYMNGLYQNFSASNYYDPLKLRIPFLHIFSRDLSKEEKYLADFETKTKLSQRFRLVLNQPHLHHWDSACEGYASCIVLQNRGTEQSNIKKSFEIEEFYLLNFFNAELKEDATSQKFLATKPDLGERQPALWDINTLNAIARSPNYDEFEDLVRKKGIDNAMDIFNTTFKNDTSTNLRQGFMMNALGSKFLSEKKNVEAVAIFKLNTQLHPDDADLFDSLAQAYEASGDKLNMRGASKRVLDILNKKTILNDYEKRLKADAENRMKPV